MILSILTTAILACSHDVRIEYHTQHNLFEIRAFCKSKYTPPNEVWHMTFDSEKEVYNYLDKHSEDIRNEVGKSCPDVDWRLR